MSETSTATGRTRSAGGATPQAVLKVGSTTSFSHVGLWAAIEANTFRNYGVGINYLTTQGGPAITLDAALNGDYDVAFVPADALMVFCSKQGSDCSLRAIASESHVLDSQLWTLSELELKTSADLKGQTIGLPNRGSSADYQLHAWLQKNNLRPQLDVNVLPMNGMPALMAALSNKRVQAGVLSYPAAFQAASQGLSELADFAQDIGPYEGSVAVVRRSLLENPSGLLGFLEGWYEGMALVRTNEQTGLSDGAKYSGIDDMGIVKQSLDAVLAEQNYRLSTSPAGLTNMQAILRSLPPDYGIQFGPDFSPSNIFTDQLEQQLARSGFFDRIDNQYGGKRS